MRGDKMSELISAICSYIREMHKNKAVTEDEFTRKCALSLAYLANIENHEWNITTQTLEKIAEELEISPLNLLKYEKLEIDEQHKDKQAKLKLLLNITKDFNEHEISRIINIVKEIKNMHE